MCNMSFLMFKVYVFMSICSKSENKHKLNHIYIYMCVCVCVCICVYIQGVSRLEDITAAGDFLGLSDQKSSYKHVSNFGRLRSYDRLKLRIEGNDYWQ